MNRSLYPVNWPEIATAIKTQADWCCQECRRPCRRPGEQGADLIERLMATVWADVLLEPVEDEEFGLIEVPSRLGRFTLTVAHLNHRPEDCRPENLRALCAPCHCRYDTQPGQMAIKKMLKLERQGQMNLLDLIENHGG